ncbi:MAG: hypothetical protein QOJ89_1406 [bacterium]
MRSPGWTRTILREARRQHVSRVVACDAVGARTLRALLRGTGPSGRTTIAIRTLDGQRVELRAASTDAEVAVATFAGRYHLPPAQLPRDEIRSVWDIGANIGLTTAHFAQRYPAAHVLALEPHPANFALAQVNVAPYAQRCTLLRSAAWTCDGRVGLEGEAGPQDGYRVSAGASRLMVSAISLNTLLMRHGSPDYVKIDVEGAERELLNDATQWAQSVRCISVECHPPYDLPTCVADLGRLGFHTTAVPRTLRRRGRDCAVGLRPPIHTI